MNRERILLTLVSVFSLSAMVLTSSAQTRKVGVSEDDWFKYGDISYDWNSNDPNATISDPKWNETEWIMILIMDVSGTSITGEKTVYYRNGTEEISGGYVDIDTGDGENATTMIISADLGVNDAVYTSGEFSTWKINETVVRTYPSGLRDTNHLNISFELSYMEFYQYMSMNYYWDKSTGVIVEMCIEEIHKTGDYVTNASLGFRIIESNVWTVPEFPSFLILPLLMITTLLAIVMYRRNSLCNIKLS
jgi:hypothetical protein